MWSVLSGGVVCFGREGRRLGEREGGGVCFRGVFCRGVFSEVCFVGGVIFRWCLGFLGVITVLRVFFGVKTKLDTLHPKFKVQLPGGN